MDNYMVQAIAPTLALNGKDTKNFLKEIKRPKNEIRQFEYF